MKFRSLYILTIAAMVLLTSCQRNDISTLSDTEPGSVSPSETESGFPDETVGVSGMMDTIRKRYPETVASVREVSSNDGFRYYIELDFDSEDAASAYRDIHELIGEQAVITWFRSGNITNWTPEDTERIQLSTVFAYGLHEIGKLEKLGDIEKARVHVETPDEEAVAEEMQRFLMNHPPIEVSDKQLVEENDLLKISYCIQDGQTIYEKDEQATVRCGQTLFDAVIEDSVRGRSVGETYTVNYPLENKYAVEPGKTAECEIRILYIYTLKEPVLDDEYTREYTPYESVDEWKDALLKSERDRLFQEAWNACAERLIASSEFSIQEEKLIDRATEFAFEVRFRSGLLGMSEEEYVRILSGEDTDDYIRWAYGKCENEIKETLIVEAIAEKAGLHVSDQELAEECAKSGIAVSALSDAEKAQLSYGLLLEKAAAYMIQE